MLFLEHQILVNTNISAYIVSNTIIYLDQLKLIKTSCMIFKQLTEQLHALSTLLEELKDEHYTKTIEHLGNASIGGHTRHIIELIDCAVQGYNLGTVDYVNRKRDLLLEGDRRFALTVLNNLKTRFNLPDKRLKLVVETSEEATNNTVDTTYYREMVYNTEHCIHHLALIKVALIEMQLNLVESNFGMAYSTLKYRSTLTQQ